MTVIAIACGAAAAAQPVTLDGAYLRYSKARLAAADATLAPALHKLVADADALLARRAESVTYKRLVPPSGDRHDYLSLAPYWWPDPARPNGLPYRLRDGEFNPSAKNDDTDSVRMQAMCVGVQKLSLAYYFTGDAKYAHKAAEAIRTWFLAPATRMNPSLAFGQAIMGKVEGRGTGLIDTRNLWMAIDAAALIDDAGVLSASELAALKQWFGAFAGWMETSRLGQDEAAAANNHGMFFDMQLAAYALFAGDAAKARSTVDHALAQRIALQVDADGKQPRELARTTPFHYSVFNLEAMTTLARYGEQVGVDVWTAPQSGRGLRQAIDYLLPFALKPASWPYPELRGAETAMLLPVLLQAERAYGAGTYAQAAASLAQTGPADTLDRLTWPLKPAR
ncbi:MAG: alginate lyase family protein [Pseudomonadota bacterium]|nr:alginate lyase family protein [Pseudomonadota bacterium]